MQHVRSAYGALAPLYIELFGSTSSLDAADLALIERHAPPAGSITLDAGCGPGHLTAHLRSLGCRAIGVDVVPEFIEHAAAAHPGCPFASSSVNDLPMADGTFDGAVAWFSLIHHQPHAIGDAMRELRRVMSTGAVLTVGFFEGPVVEAFDHKVTTAYRWPVDEFSQQLNRSGFREIERLQRPGSEDGAIRSVAAIAATAD